jgi:hypothetical protein
MKIITSGLKSSISALQNFILFKIIGENCGKTYKEVIEFSRRDRWYNSDEALEFGLIDNIIGSENNTISKMLDGFDEYYQNEVLNIK